MNNTLTPTNTHNRADSGRSRLRTLLIVPALALAACVSTPGSVPVADGPVARTIVRVLDRTQELLDTAPPELGVEEQRGPIEAAIQVARAMVLLPEADGDMLLVAMGNIMGLHDFLVMMMVTDQLEVEIYLEDTARLRSLFQSVSIHQPAQ